MSRTLAYLPLGAVLVVGGALRLIHLGQNGYSREYYAAAVRSQLQSWHNTFYNAFDPGGFVSLDKPPVGIWVQTLFAKLFGFSAINTLLPQVLLGLLAVLLLYWLVRRTFGERAGLVAALVLALNPGNIAVDRSNNLESCLIVILLGAAYLAMRAAETGRLRYLAGAMLMAGIGFNVKMAAALIIVPVIAIVFFVFNGQQGLWRQFRYQAVAGMVLLVTALAWVTAFDLTPSDQRPYAGSTKQNSMFELVLKHNGTDRFTNPSNKVALAIGASELSSALYDTSPVGPLRLFRPLQAGQFAWLLPLALAGIFFGWRADAERRQRRIAISVWAGWLAIYWLVFSAAGGPFHTYYLAALAAPLAALAGVGATGLWSRTRAGAYGPALAVLALVVLWQTWLFYGQTGTSAPVWLLGVAATALLLALLAAMLLAGGNMRTRPALSIIPLAAVFVLPLAAALSVVVIRPNVIAPAATLAAYGSSPRAGDADRLNPRRRDASRTKLIAFLLEHRTGEKFIVAVENALMAAPLIIATGQPVMTLGGYLGTDPILTPEVLRELVQRGVVRYAMTGGLSFTKRNQPQEIALRDWIRTAGAPVDAVNWSMAPQLAGKTFNIRIGGTPTAMEFPALFDLRPATGR